MEQWERDYHVSRIVSGTLRCRVGGAFYTLTSPSREARQAATEVYRDSLREASMEGVISADEVPLLLVRLKLWSPEKDQDVTNLTEAIEDGKAGLYENWNRSDARAAIRSTLSGAKTKLAELEGVKHSLDHMTCEGVAVSSKMRFLTGNSLLLPDGTPYWKDPWSCWNKPDSVVDQAMEFAAKTRLTEMQVRDLVRNEPWRSIWSVREVAGRGLFDVAAVDVRDEQHYMVFWSNLYESVRKHDECPDDDIIEDDDALDGWLITQRRKRENALITSRLDKIKNPKIKNADQVFLVADNIEDARKIEKLNDVNASNAKARRFQQLKEAGELNEMEFEDTQQRFRMEVAKAASQQR